MTTIKLENKLVRIGTEWNDYKNRQIRKITVFFDNIDEIDADLFETKISQSKDASKKGKLAFKFLGYKLNDQQEKYSYMVPASITADMSNEDKKAAFKAAVAKYPEIKFCMWNKIGSPFLNVELADDTYTVFDNNQFPGDTSKSPKENRTIGYPGYFIKRDTRLDVTFTKAMSKEGNEYLQTKLSSKELTGEDVFDVRRRGRVFGQPSDGGSDSVIDSLGGIDVEGFADEF